MRSILLSTAVSIVIAVSVASTVDAAAPAFDSAADPAYAPYLNTGTLPEGINGGYGWGPWEEMDTSFSNVTPNAMVNVTATSGFAWQSPITSPGAVWGIPAAGDLSMCLARYFDGALAVGQTFSFDYSNVIGVYIISSDHTHANYELYYNLLAITGSQYTSLPVNVPSTIEGDHASLTVTDSGHATLTITSYGPNGGTESFEMPYTDVEGVAFQAGKGDIDGFVNNLSITPEPGSAALIAVAGLGLLLRRSRKGRSLNIPGSHL